MACVVVQQEICSYAHHGTYLVSGGGLFTGFSFSFTLIGGKPVVGYSIYEGFGGIPNRLDVSDIRKVSRLPGSFFVGYAPGRVADGPSVGAVVCRGYCGGVQTGTTDTPFQAGGLGPVVGLGMGYSIFGGGSSTLWEGYNIG
jgi:hypothetical protein